MAYYRTRTYIAADFDHDKDAVDQLYTWKNSNHWSLDFSDAHDLQTSSDNSLPCSIKDSLSMRMSASKTFVLIVGDHTNSITKGGCQLCGSYNSYNYSCARGHSVDYRSYVKYECDIARKTADEGKMKIVVLYKSTTVDKSKCPEAVRDIGYHVQMEKYENGNLYWDYQSVKAAFDWANG